MEPAVVVAGTFVGRPAGDAGTGSAPAVTAESAEPPKNKGKEREEATGNGKCHNDMMV